VANLFDNDVQGLRAAAEAVGAREKPVPFEAEELIGHLVVLSVHVPVVLIGPVVEPRIVLRCVRERVQPRFQVQVSVQVHVHV
jgi:hypothetical protein